MVFLLSFSRHPNAKFSMENEVNKVIPFLDILILSSNILNTATYHKSTYSGLSLNFDSFTSRSYKISLIKCLIDPAYKINNTWASFHNDVTEIKETLKCDSFPPFLIDRITKSYLNKVQSNSDQSNPESDMNLHTLENIQSKFRKSCQKAVNSSAKTLILELFLLLLKLITVSQLKIKHYIFWCLF